MSSVWTFGLVDINGRNVTEAGLPLASQRKLLFQLGAPNICVFTLPLTSIEAAILEVGLHYVKAWESIDGADKVLRFNGPCWTDEVRGADNLMMVSALDPMVYLNKRFTTLKGTGDQGTAIKSMIDTTNSVDGETGIRTNTANITASSTTTTDYSTQTPSIMTAVQQFATQLDGCDIWLQPIDYSAGKIADLYISPQRGSSKPGAIFGFGDGTVANCVDMTRIRNMDLVENDIGGYTDTLAREVTDETSAAAYRRLKSYISYTGETGSAALASRTLGRLAERYSPSAAAEYACVPTPRAPELFRDFDIGDTVPLDFRRGKTFQVSKRVRSAELTIGETGVATLTGLDFKGNE